MDGQHGLVIALEQIAWFLTPVLELAIVFVLWRRRSLKLFRFFVIYLMADAVRSTSLWILGGSSTFAEIYRIAWIDSEPLILCLNVTLVWELIRLLYKAYPGIHSFAKIAISIAVLVAILLTVFSSPLDIRRATTTASDRTLLRFLQVERVLDLGLSLIVFVTVGLFPSSHYARPIRQHGFLLSALFASISAGYFAINYGFNSEVSGLATLAVELGLYGWWLRLFMAPEPERLPIPSPEEVARLDQLNEDLLALSRWLKN